jgi:alpha-glucosidase
MQLGTLYPFARNHNSINTISQEPYAFGPMLLDASITAIRLRYSLLNYMYSLMFDAAVNGGMIFKPAMFVYPTD